VLVDKLEEKVANMRILENVDFPSFLSSLLPIKPKIPINTHVEKEETTFLKPTTLVQMANLSMITGHKVNGVASIHTRIVKEEVFVDFYEVCDSSQRFSVVDAQ